MPAPALQVQQLSKQYTVGARTGPVTLYETLSGWLRPDARERGPQETFWALRGVDFEVAPGEVVGIVGPNGAGNTVLVNIITG
jgi:ABC-type polysaccharide/polyol phosphate transport system ATPase subunit